MSLESDFKKRFKRRCRTKRLFPMHLFIVLGFRKHLIRERETSLAKHNRGWIFQTATKKPIKGRRRLQNIARPLLHTCELTDALIKSSWMTYRSHNWTTVSTIFIWLSQIQTEKREPDTATDGNIESFTRFGINGMMLYFVRFPSSTCNTHGTAAGVI